jgi:hypothetical protein
MQLNFAFEISLSFGIFPEHIDKFVPIWQKFKNLLALWISLLQSQQFTSVNFLFLIIV